MASDLSSNCTDSLSKFDDEREEGEISLEDVSSSEEGQPANSKSRLCGQYRCDHCASTKQCTPWCPYHPSNLYKSHNKKDIAYGKENRQLSRDSGNLGGKHAFSTLQEKNDDLVPISSDSDLEIVRHDNGLDKNAKRSRKRKRKRKAYRDPERSTNVILNDDSTDEVVPPFEPPKLVAKNELSRLRKDETLRRPRDLSPRRHKSLSRVRKKRPSTSSSKMIRKIPRRVPREVDAENYNYRLLRKVKRLEDGKSQKTTQTEKQKGLSLKDKLQNMLNKETDHSKDKENVDNKGETDDEDVVRLRQLALQTKPTSQEEVAKVTTSSNGEEEDDEDSEALKLRLIALKSAIQKKYQRKDKKLKNKLEQTRPDSPLDNLLDPKTPQKIENKTQPEEKNCQEDMDLDTDIEREKEKGEDGDSPYSPSDNLSLERELLGINPSDVCCMENKSTSAKESSSIYYDDNSSPYCPSEPISNSCDFSPSSPTSSFHLSNDFDSDRDVLSPTDSLLNSSSFEIQSTPLVKQNKVHTLPLSPPPAPPQICTITNFLCASFVDEIEKDLDGSPLVSIEQENPSKIEQTSLCDTQLGLLSLNPTTQPVNDPVQHCISTIEMSSNSRPKSLKKRRSASALKELKTRANLKPVPMTSIPQAPLDIPPQDIIPVKPNANDQQITQPIEIAQNKGQEMNRKRERKGDNSDEPSIKVAKQPDSKTQNPLAEVPQRKVSADEDELMLREMLIASLGKRKADLQPGHSKVMIQEKKNEKPAPEPVPASTKILSNAQVPISEKKTVVKPTKEGLTSTTGVATENAATKKRADLVNPNRFVTKKPVRSTVFPSLAMSNVVNKVNKPVVPGPPAKKINLQKMSVTFNAQNTINPAMRKVNIKDNSSMMSPLNDLSEFVIKVSEDSASDCSEEESSADKIKRPPLKIPKSEFEKRIDTFLKEVRMNSENNKTKKPARTIVKTKKVPETAISTPAAVRHLSASKQEEYRRLKQQILEREKKLQKTSVAPTQSASKGNQKSVLAKSSTPVLKSTLLAKTKTVSKPNISEPNKILPRPNQTVVKVSKEATNLTIGNKSVEVIEEPEKPQDQTEKRISVENEAEKEKETKDETSSEATVQNAKPNDEKEAQHSDNAILQTSEENVNQEIRQPCEDVQMRDKEEECLKDVPDVETTNIESTVDESKVVDIEVMNGSLEITYEKAQSSLDFKTTKVSEEKAKEDKRGGILKVLSIPELNSRLEHNQCDISPPLRTEPEVEDDKSENDSVIIVKDSENTQSHDSAAQSDISNAGLLTTCKSESSAPRNDRREIHRELQQMASLPSKEQQEQLLNMEKDLVSTRYSFLDDLTQLEQVYIQWQQEKEQQQNLSKEIKELRSKLKLAEQKLQEQKTRLNEMNVSAAACHDKVNHGRDEYNKLSRVCNGLGHRLHGANYKIPAAGAPLVSNKLKVVAAFSEKFYSQKAEKSVKEKSEKKPSNMINPFAKKDANQTESSMAQTESQSDQIDEPSTTDSNNRLAENETDTVQKDRVQNSSKENEMTPRPYESCLSHLKDTRSTAVDGILCPFELRGTCNDTECAFVHHPKKC